MLLTPLASQLPSALSSPVSSPGQEPCPRGGGIHRCGLKTREECVQSLCWLWMGAGCSRSQRGATLASPLLPPPLCLTPSGARVGQKQLAGQDLATHELRLNYHPEASKPLSLGRTTRGGEILVRVGLLR